MKTEEFEIIVNEELQIGNLINAIVDNELEIAEIQGLGSFSIDLKTESGCMGDFEDYEVEPIVITRDLLIDSGFNVGINENGDERIFIKSDFIIKEVSGQFYVVSFGYILNDNGLPKLFDNDNFQIKEIHKPISYVHQLQNSYYWITHEKLKLSIDIGLLEFCYSKGLVESTQSKNVSYPPKRKKKKNK